MSDTVVPQALPTALSSASELPDQSTWRGWAEIENDPKFRETEPAYWLLTGLSLPFAHGFDPHQRIFNIMLREWGVEGVKVEEVVTLDAIHEFNPSSTLGLIFLSRSSGGVFESTAQALHARQKAENKQEDEQEEKDAALTRDVWFANQISTYSCATVALMNILGNAHVEKQDIGPQLSHFLADTRGMSSKERGILLDQFEHVRKVHNSFATAIDMQSVDLGLRDEVLEYKRQNSKKPQRRTEPMKPDSKALDKGQISSETESSEQQTYHFTAYVPSYEPNILWRLDGMERNPEMINRTRSDSTESRQHDATIVVDSNGSTCDPTTSMSSQSPSWLDVAFSELSDRIATQAAAHDDIDVSILRLVATGSDLDENAETLTTEMDIRMREDWGPALQQMVKCLVNADDRDLGI